MLCIQMALISRTRPCCMLCIQMARTSLILYYPSFPVSYFYVHLSGFARRTHFRARPCCMLCIQMAPRSTYSSSGLARKLAKTDAKTNDVDCRASFAKTDTSLDEGTGAVVFASHSTAIHVVTSFVFVDRRVPRLRARTSRRQPPSPSSFASCNEVYMPCLPCMRRHGRQAIHTVHLLKTPFHPTTTIKFNHFFYSEIRVYWLVFYGGKTALIALCNPERLSCRPGN